MKQLPFLNDAAGGSATPAVLNPRRPAIIVPVQVTGSGGFAERCRTIAATGIVDVIEWRIDPLIAEAAGALAVADDDRAVQATAQMLAEAVVALAPAVISAGLPVLVTLRTGFEGGVVDMSEDLYAQVLLHLIAQFSDVTEGGSNSTRIEAEIDAQSNAVAETQVGRQAEGQICGQAEGQRADMPIALDVEIDRHAARDLIAAAHERRIPVVASHHNFSSTDAPETLRATFETMSAAGADVLKVAMMPQSSGDVADLLRTTAEADASFDRPVLGISMGEAGRTSRVMGGDFGSCASFAQLGQSSAPGQIDALDLAGMFDRLYC